MNLKNLLMVIAGLIVLAVPLAAQKRATPCTQATLKGSYGIIEEGAFFGSPYVGAAIITYDGAGHYSGTAYGNIDGAPIPGTLTGTYTVNPDCTYSDEMTTSLGPAHTSGVITGDGVFRELHYIYADAGISASGTSRKMPPNGCRTSTVKGNYAVYGAGSIVQQLPGFPPPPFPVVHEGKFLADGAGHFTGADISSIAGAPALPGTFTGNYDLIDHSCAVSVVITDSTGLVVHEWGFISGIDEFQEIHTIVIDGAWLFAENIKKQ